LLPVCRHGGSAGNANRELEMIRRSTWITIGVFIILLGFVIYWNQIRIPEESEDPTALPESPWNISLTEITGVTITNYELGKTLELQKTMEGNWIELAPEEGLVDAQKVEQALNWLTMPNVSREISTEGGLAQFGLDEPKGMITVFTQDGNTNFLLVGDNTPIGNQTYTIVPNTYHVLLISKFDVNSIMELAGMELVLTPEPEETQTIMEPEVP
jgi:hypothetical protein